MIEEKIKETTGYESKSSQYSNVPEDPNFSAAKIPAQKSSKPLIAGILLMIAGVLALIFWFPVITVDVSTIESVVNVSQFQELDPTMTPEKLKGILTICGTIACILAVFSILGGNLSWKRKLWGIALTGSILGLFTIGFLISSILSLIGLILIIISKKEFQ